MPMTKNDNQLYQIFWYTFLIIFDVSHPRWAPTGKEIFIFDISINFKWYHTENVYEKTRECKILSNYKIE